MPIFRIAADKNMTSVESTQNLDRAAGKKHTTI